MALTPFEGRDVIQATIRVTKAGDGLSKALGVDPQEFHHGQRVTVVLDTIVGGIDHLPIKDTDCLNRRHTLEAEAATIIDRDLVSAALDSQAERIQLAKEASQGVQRLDLTGDPAEGDGAGEGDAGNSE